MSIQVTEASSTATQGPAGVGVEDWELDVSIVESGPSADRLIQMTDDGCGQTCQSACSATCP